MGINRSMRGFTLILFLALSCLTVRTKAQGQSNQTPAPGQETTTFTVPMGGNAFIKQGTENGARITNKGLENWTNAKTVTSVYFGIRQACRISLAIQLKQNNTAAAGKFNVTIFGKTYPMTIKGQSDTLHITDLSVAKPGYVRLDLQGLENTGNPLEPVTAVILTGNGLDSGITYVADAKDFHFGRRGPSVHMNFQVPDDLKNKVQYFYNEIYVPKGQDIVGSYFEANGFAFGYLGMQVNSATERRVLFSVWSPFTTDHPQEIPADDRIELVKKGKDVHGGAFGGEGSGGQSYLTYNWKAGDHYAFLLKAEPDSIHKTTVFTAYFKNTNDKQWLLIASFRRPKTVSSLDHLYSFLENFQPSMGNITRRGYYTNQWLRSFDGKWVPVEKAMFTTDATGNAGQRDDYIGGVDEKGFFLENCGFFDGNGPQIRKTLFQRVGKPGQRPRIDVNSLP